MTVMIGRNRNTNDEARVETITVNSVTAVVVAAANPKRLALVISLDEGTDDIDAFIRLYPAADDNDKKGILLARQTFANDNLYFPMWQMQPDNVYTGEISIITEGGTFDVHVTEY